jgi:assimilatory nitrate reductase catalytic subunit
VEINPRDAKQVGLRDGGFGRVQTQHGTCILRVVVTDSQPCGEMFVPIHWTDETASHARVDALVAPFVDPHSGQPESKASAASIAPVKYSREGFLLAREPIELPRTIWWVRVRVKAGYGYRVACNMTDDDWLEKLRLFAGEDVVTLTDVERGSMRGAAFSQERAQLAWALAPRALPWDGMLEQFSHEIPDRLAFLSGGLSIGVPKSPLICACFGVSEEQITALVSSGLRTPIEIGAACKAGTNCGSCVPEIRRLASQR